MDDGKVYKITHPDFALAAPNAILLVSGPDHDFGQPPILVTFAMIAVYDAVRATGAAPVLCDSDPVTWNLDPVAVGAVAGARTRAIVAVHTYGLPCDMTALARVARRVGAALVEDAAEAHGATLRGVRAGALARIADLVKPKKVTDSSRLGRSRLSPAPGVFTGG